MLQEVDAEYQVELDVASPIPSLAMLTVALPCLLVGFAFGAGAIVLKIFGSQAVSADWSTTLINVAVTWALTVPLTIVLGFEFNRLRKLGYCRTWVAITADQFLIDCPSQWNPSLKTWDRDQIQSVEIARRGLTLPLRWVIELKVTAKGRCEHSASIRFVPASWNMAQKVSDELHKHLGL